MHGGTAPQVRAAAAARTAEAKAARAAATMGLPINIDPHLALLQEVHRAAGVVAWLGAEVALLAPDVITFGVSKEVDDDGGEKGPSSRVERTAGTNALIKLWGEERDRLVRAAKAAIDAGVNERLVRLEEAKGELLAAVILRILDDPALGLSPDQAAAARQVAARELRALPEAS